MAKQVAASGKVPASFVKNLLVSPHTLDATMVEAIELGYSAADKDAIRIMSIEYYVLSDFRVNHDNLPAALANNGDSVSFGFKSTPATLSVRPLIGDAGMIDYNTVTRADMGTAATGNYLRDPYITKNMMDLFPNGLLCHPSQLSMWAWVNDATAGALSIMARVYYFIETLTVDQYQELLNTLLIQQL